MTKKLLLVVAMMCALTLAVMAADVSGKWTWEQQGRNGAQTSTLTLKASGSTLTGSLDGGRGGAIDISDGKVDGNMITFTVKRDMGGQTMSTTYKGTLDGDSLTLEFTRPGRGGAEPTPVKVTAKRATT
jgi:hypothetical protein